MIKTSKTLSTSLLILAVVLGIGSVLLFAVLPVGGFRLFKPRWSTATVLLWDVALSLVFFLQHSGMIRRSFRARLAGIIAPRYHGAVYATASGIALAAVALLWQPSDRVVLSIVGWPRYLLHASSLAALGLFVWGARSLRPFDPLGLTPLIAHLRDKAESPPVLVVRGAYRLVRHPLYLAVLALIWSSPDVTVDRLLFQALWSAWILLGAHLEEKDLAQQLGEPYRAYCRQTPMIIPWPRRKMATALPHSWAGSRGEGYVVIQLLLIAVVLLGPRTWPGLRQWPAEIIRIAFPIGVALIALGSGLIVSGMVALGRNLAAVPRPKQGARLVERGPYRFVRHPMYAGAIAIAFGWALAVHGSLSLVYAFAIVVFLAIKAAREERWLREELVGYVDYERRVRRMIPFIY